MKKIQIKTKDFFELLKIKETSMWDIFTQMIDNEEKEIIFLDNDNNILFNYILPNNIEKLQSDKKIFIENFSLKIKESLN
jgi:hypothetical protein